MPALTRHLRSRRGFTLLELLVVGMIGTLVITMVGNAWAWYGRSIREQQLAVLLAQELKIAAEAIAQDYGPAVGSRTTGGNNIQLNLDSPGGNGSPDWAAPDTVIEYSITSENLIRRNVITGAELPVAAHIRRIEAATVSGHLQLTVTAGFRGMEHALTLHLTGS